jgi:hypothetical protein
MQRIHQVGGEHEGLLLDVDEIARAGARRMLAEALEAEVADYIEATAEQRDEQGRTLMVRNGYARERSRSSWEPGPWRSRLRGSTTVESMRRATGEDS